MLSDTEDSVCPKGYGCAVLGVGGGAYDARLRAVCAGGVVSVYMHSGGKASVWRLRQYRVLPACYRRSISDDMLSLGAVVLSEIR